jgi:hypothetical protein
MWIITVHSLRSQDKAKANLFQSGELLGEGGFQCHTQIHKEILSKRLVVTLLTLDIVLVTTLFRDYYIYIYKNRGTRERESARARERER